MKRRMLPQGIGPSPLSTTKGNCGSILLCAVTVCALAALLAVAGSAQVITIDTSGRGTVAGNGPVDRQYAQIVPTRVELSKTVLDPKTRLMLIRALMSEQGFAMRPFPRGHKGLTLQANGKLEPVGESYVNLVINEGLSAKPGSRVVITDIKIDRSKIVFDLDGGPDAKHRFLRHIQVGVGPDIDDPNMDMDPALLDQSGDPSGSRLTLAFGDHIPELTPAQVKALLAPLISFDVKTPIQAFTDTLPLPLKDAILNHKVWVGMSTDMVLFAKGRPNTKSREMDGQMPFEVWIYGTPPEDVTFVRINGNRVIRVEIAKVGQPLQVFTKDVVSPMLMTSGSPELAAQSNTRVVHEGDVETDPNKQAPAPPPSLRNPGEKLPTDNQSVGVMRPVQFPKPHPDEEPGANPDEQPSTPPANGQGSQTNSGQAGSQQGSQAGKGQASPQSSQSPPASAPQSAPAKTQAPGDTQAPASGSQQPPPASQLVSTDDAVQRN
ncbi:MAG: hypothetical protein WB341_03180 [Terracidiphilus sp.]